MITEIKTIIFSKNRACQLELLLRTLKFDNVYVIYLCDSKFLKGYEKVKAMYPGVNFIKQEDFKIDTLVLLDTPYTMFLCDDDIMIRSFDASCREFKFFKDNSYVVCMSLRLSRNYDYNFLKDRKEQIPHFIGGSWEWKKYRGDWGYPMSVTSHIYRTSDIMPILEKHEFNNPHGLERVMKHNCPDNPIMIGLKNAVFINNLANQVQNGFPNKHGEQSAKYLDSMFLKEHVIDAQDIIGKAVRSKSCFMMENYSFAGTK